MNPYLGLTSSTNIRPNTPINIKTAEPKWPFVVSLMSPPWNQYYLAPTCLARYSFFQSARPRLPACGRDRTIAGHSTIYNQRFPTPYSLWHHTSAQTASRPWRRARCRSYSRSLVPDISVIPHIRSLKLQPIGVAKFFKHPFHKAYGFFFGVARAVRDVLKRALRANQIPAPRSSAGAKIASQDPAEASPSVYAIKSPAHVCPPMTVRHHLSCIISQAVRS